MATTLLFNTLPEASPSSPPTGYILTTGSGEARITSGLFDLFSGTQTIWAESTPQAGTIISATVVLNSASTDSSGPALITAGGSGYLLLVRNTDIRLFLCNSGVLGSQIGSTFTVANAGGQALSLKIDKDTGLLTALKNGAELTTWTNTTYSNQTLLVGAMSRGAELRSVTGDSEAAAPTITLVGTDDTCRVGQVSVNLDVEGFNLPISYVTIGGTEIEALDEINANAKYTFTVPSFVNNTTYIPLGTQEILVATSSDTEAVGYLSAVKDIELNNPINYSEVIYTSVSTEVNSLAAQIALHYEDFEIEIDDIQYYVTSEITIGADSQLSAISPGLTTTWLRKSPTHSTTPNLMYQIILEDGLLHKLILETTDSVFSVEQVVDTWNTNDAQGSEINGNWLKVLEDELPDTTPGVPFSFGVHSVHLKLLLGSQTSTRTQDYLPPTGYTALEYSSITSSNATNSIWNGISGLVNGSQILVSNSQIADDTTAITVSWGSNGIGIPNQNLDFTSDFVYFNYSNGELSKLEKSYTASNAGIISINGGLPLEAGELFTIDVLNVNTDNIHFVILTIGSKVWTLPKNSTVDTNTINVLAPSDLSATSSLVITIKEWKVSEGTVVSSDITWIETPQTSNFLAVEWQGYLIDTSSNVITMTLPLTPQIGDKIPYLDLSANFAVNNFTINPNGNNFYGSTDNYITSSTNESGVLMYTGATYGWKFINVSPTI